MNSPATDALILGRNASHVRRVTFALLAATTWPNISVVILWSKEVRSCRHNSAGLQASAQELELSFQSHSSHGFKGTTHRNGVDAHVRFLSLQLLHPLLKRDVGNNALHTVG